MVGQPLELRHQRAQIDGARRRLVAERRLRRLREGKRIGDGAVAGGAASELRAVSSVAPSIRDSMPLWT